MEIIKPRTDKQHRVTCPTCGAIIGYYDTDVSYWVIPPKPGRFHVSPGVGFNHIVCPSCKVRIRLDEEEKI